MGGTGYQPVLVGNLPTRVDKDTLLRRRQSDAGSLTSLPAGLVARRNGQVARSTHRL